MLIITFRLMCVRILLSFLSWCTLACKSAWIFPWSFSVNSSAFLTKGADVTWSGKKTKHNSPLWRSSVTHKMFVGSGLLHLMSFLFTFWISAFIRFSFSYLFLWLELNIKCGTYLKLDLKIKRNIWRVRWYSFFLFCHKMLSTPVQLLVNENI